jgi:hypothetical protein
MDFVGTIQFRKLTNEFWEYPNSGQTTLQDINFVTVPRRQRSCKQKQPRKDDNSFFSARFRQKERSKPAELGDFAR